MYGGDFTAVKVAVVGVGNMGRHHARVYNELKSSELLAVADTNVRVAKEIAKKFNINWYPNHLKLLEEEDVDAVSVGTPTSMHCSICKDILNQKKHVLVEKPIALNLEQAEEMISCAKKNNVLLMVGHVERFNPAVLKLKAIMDDKSLGEIVSLSSRRVGFYTPGSREIIDVVIEFAIHDIDVMRFLVGSEVKSVYSRIESKFSNVKDFVSAVLEFENGIIGVIESNLFTPTKIRNMHVTGTKGYALLDYINQDISLYGQLTDKGFKDYEDLILKYSNTVIGRPFVAKNEPLKVELEHFLDCIISNKPPISNGEEGRKNLEVTQMMFAASERGDHVLPRI